MNKIYYLDKPGGTFTLKEVEIGVADANSDYLLYDELKKELTIIETIIEVQMFLN